MTVTSEDHPLDTFLGHTLLQQHHIRDADEQLVRRPTAEEMARLEEMAVPGTPQDLEQVIEHTREILSYRIALGHTRFFSCIPSPASPVSWFGEALTNAFNPFAGNLSAGPGICAIERALVKWIANQFGLPSTAGGQFVSGASIANMTAMTVARDHKLAEHTRSQGVVYISDQAHFCVRKALRIIGFSDRQIQSIPVDSSFRMDVRILQQAITSDLDEGLRPFLIVVTFGTTNTGTIDPLLPIIDIAKTNNLWLHVDAAYGGAVAFSAKHRRKIEGLGQVDSIAWDAHKWMFQTHGCGLVLFRDGTHPLKSFAAGGEYVRDVSVVRDPSNYGIELTRPARHMKLWFTLQVLGTEAIENMINWGIELAIHAEEKLRSLDHWEITSPANLAILTFRYAPPHLDEIVLDRLNETISKEMIARNVAVMFTTILDGKVCLRMCTINPNTTMNEITYVIQVVEDVAASCLQQSAHCRDNYADKLSTYGPERRQLPLHS
jgi:glutamate/tyrosine decarboxylase-like PLP-dependent enzyme